MIVPLTSMSWDHQHLVLITLISMQAKQVFDNALKEEQKQQQ